MKKLIKNTAIIILNCAITLVWMFVASFWGNIIPVDDPISAMMVALYSEGVAVILLLLIYHRNSEIIALPFKKFKTQYLSGFLLGFAWFGLTWLTCVRFGGFVITRVFSRSNWWRILLFLGGFMIQSMCEELLFRGFLMGKICRLNLPLTAIIVNSVGFTLVHGANPGFDLAAALGIFIFALSMSFIRLQTQNLWFVGAYHAAWNFAEGVVFGTSVSGTIDISYILKSEPNLLKPLFNGGKFGVEASLVNLIFELLFLALVIGFFYGRNPSQFRRLFHLKSRTT